ncbi:MAG: nitroreductase family protein [Anaerolineae bacterium]|jgi:coenzyme F420-0:L-glutamate ligase / coenzyme F420-1:gamma-L-glutamate ligase|nr:nitroreductase family protein [Anaerolineae bacterium]
MNEFHHFLRTRRSIRRFKPDPVPATLVERILATATFAPSAHNLQPWRFALIQSNLAREKLGVALTEKMRTDMDAEGADPAQIEKRTEISLRRIAEAPLIILLCRDETAIRKEEPEEHTMGIQSVALAGLQLILAAHAEGLGANWICWPLYAQKETIDTLDLPESWLPEAMIFLGYADEELGEKVLKKQDKVVKSV